MFHRPKSEDNNAGSQNAAGPAKNDGQNKNAPVAKAVQPTKESAFNQAGGTAPNRPPVMDAALPAQRPAAASQPNAAQPPAQPNEMPSAPMQPQTSAEPTAQAPVQPQAPKPENSEKENKTMTNPADKASEPSTSGENFSRPLDIPGTAGFQRPGATGPQAPRMPGAGYTPGNYGAGGNPYTSVPAAASASAPTEVRNLNNSRRLVVGEGITMSGEIESCDTLMVEGTVEAALKGASILDIAETGVFYGTVEINECTIAGRFEGDITVHGRLTVKASGSITGSIAYKELAVESGATVDGKLSPLSANGKKAEKKDGKPSAKAAKLGQGGELPFAGHATAAE